MLIKFYQSCLLPVTVFRYLILLLKILPYSFIFKCLIEYGFICYFILCILLFVSTSSLWMEMLVIPSPPVTNDVAKTICTLTILHAGNCNWKIRSQM